MGRCCSLLLLLLAISLPVAKAAADCERKTVSMLVSPDDTWVAAERAGRMAERSEVGWGL
jgi:hypothetical protein